MSQAIATIDVTAYEWFDHSDGSSYFAAIVTVNKAAQGEHKFTIPFQYGYGDYYKHEVMQALIKRGLVDESHGRTQLTRYCRVNNIALCASKLTNCTQAKLNEISKPTAI